MKQTPKRFLTSLAATALAAILLPTLPIAAETRAVTMPTSVVYTPTKTDAAIVPASVINTDGALATYVLGRGDMLVTSKFTKSGLTYTTVSGADAGTLSTSHSFKHSENKKWSVDYRWTIGNSTGIQTLMRANQVQIGLNAKLTPDSHNPVFDHGRKTDRAQAYINVVKREPNTRYINTDQVAYISNASDDGDEVARTYQNTGAIRVNGTVYPLVDYREEVQYLQFIAGARDCACGSSKVAEPKIWLYDTTAPTVKAAYPSDANGVPLAYDYDVSENKWVGTDLHVSLDEVGYFTIECTEPVRFSDNDPEQLQLMLDVIDRATRQENKNVQIPAVLAKVTGSKLVFAFKAPEEGDYIVTGISPANARGATSDTNWVKSTNAFTLVLLNNAGGTVSFPNGSSLGKVDSAITDIAGNALVWENDVMLDYRIYTDSTIPAASGVEVGGSMISADTDYKEAENWPADLDRSTVFAGVGDTVFFTVEVNEELVSLVPIKFGDNNTTEMPFYMNQLYSESKQEFGTTSQYTSYLAWNPIVADTNIRNKDGHTITVRAVAYRTRYGAGANDTRTHTYIGFENVKIEPGYSTPNGEPVRITEVRFTKPVCDVAGNLLAGSGTELNVSGASPKQKIYIDITPPTVTVDGESTSLGTTTDGAKVVTVPFTVQDIQGTGEPYASGCANIDGTLTVSIGGDYQYAITTTAENPESAAEYQSPSGSIPYTAIDQTQYLHLRLNPTTKYPINAEYGTLIGTVTAHITDYAGNTASHTGEITDATIDTIQPTVVFANGATVSDNALAAQVTVNDNAYIQTITYQWGSEQEVTVEVPAETTSHSFLATGGPKEGTGKIDLTVTATDGAGNRVASVHSYPYDRTTKTPVFEAGAGFDTATHEPALKVMSPVSQDNQSYTTLVFTTLELEEGTYTYLHKLRTGEEVIDNLFTTESSTYYDTTKITFTETDEVTSIAATVGPMTTSVDTFLKMLSDYNGTATVRIVNLPSGEWSPSNTGTLVAKDAEKGISTIEKLTYKISKAPSLDVSFGTVTDANGQTVTNLAYPNNATTPTLQTLTGLCIPIGLANQTASIGLEVLDPSGSYAVLERLDGDTWTTVTDTQMQLAAVASQDYVVTKELFGHTARYRLKVVLAYTNGTTTADNPEYKELFMDDTPFDDVYPVEYAMEYYYKASSNSFHFDETFTKSIGDGASSVTIGIAAPTASGMSAYVKHNPRTLTFETKRTTEDAALKAAFPALFDQNLEVQVYNSLDTNGATKAKFSSNATYTVEIVSAFPATYADNTIYLLDEDSAQELVYTVKLQNGTTRTPRTLTVNTVRTTPEFAITYTPDSNDASRVKGQLTTSSDYTQAVLDTDEYRLFVNHYGYRARDDSQYDPNKYDTTTENFAEIVVSDADTWIVNEQAYYAMSMNEMYYFLVDENLNLHHLKHNEAVDIARPYISQYSRSNGSDLSTYNSADGQLCLSAYIGEPDGSLDPNSLKLHIVVKNPAETDTFPSEIVWDIPVDPFETGAKEASWDGLSGNRPESAGGVYYVRATMANTKFPQIFDKGTNLTVTAQLPPEYAGKELLVYISCKDTAGHASYDIPGGFTITSTDSEDKLSGGAVATNAVSIIEEFNFGYCLDMKTTFPSKILSPAQFAEDSFTKIREMPIYTPGDETFIIEDLFGNITTQVVTIPDVFSSLEATVTDNGDGQPVTVRVWDNGTGEKTGVVDIYFVPDAEDAELYDGVIENGVGTIDVYENGTVTVHSKASVHISIPIVASAVADTVLEPVSVKFYDRDGVPIADGDTTTKYDFVTAVLVCDEELAPAGSALSYVFRAPQAAGASHLFTFTDLAGNAGTLTAELPFAIEASTTEVPADETAPIYTLRAYSMRGQSYKLMGSYESDITETTSVYHTGKLETLLAQNSFMGQAYRLAFTVTDDSDTRVIVKTTDAAVDYATESDQVEGLTVGTSTVTYVGEGTTVYITIMDAFDNATETLPVTFPATDTIAPTATVVYVQDTATSVRAYLMPDEEGVIVSGASGLGLDATGDYAGKYYYTFTANGSYTFHFADAAGNAGVVVATVASLDTAEITHISTKWLVGGKVYEDAADLPTAAATNTVVTAVVTFSREVQGLLDPDGADITAADYEILGNRVTFVYDENTDLFTMNAFAFNGKRVTVTMPAIACIDTAAPNVTASYRIGKAEAATLTAGDTITIPTKGTVTLTFTTEAGAKSNNIAKETAADSGVFTCTVGAGDYSFLFYDAVGNETRFPVKVAADPALTMTFSAYSDGAGATTLPSSLELEAGQPIYVRINKAANVTLADTTIPGMTANTWVACTIPTDGNLAVFHATAGDEDVYAYLSYKPADKTAPTIYLAGGSIVFPLGMTEDALTAALLDGVTARDDRDADVTVTVSLGDAVGKTDVAGTYTVTYTAADTTGNKATATRTLILAKTAATLYVDGKSVMAGETLTLDTAASHRFTISGTGDEPVYLAIKEGYKTAAQMKTGATVLLADPYTDAIAHTMGAGFYTVLLRTQDRITQVVYLYIS